MAKVRVDYEYKSTFRTEVEVPDHLIAEVLDEWRNDNRPDWEPDEADIKQATLEALQEISDDVLDYQFDEETGWGDYEWLEETIIEPFKPENTDWVCPGQEELAL